MVTLIHEHLDNNRGVTAAPWEQFHYQHICIVVWVFKLIIAL